MGDEGGEPDRVATGARLRPELTAELDRSALSAVANWVFAPATLAGKPVPVYYTLTINFEVDFRSLQP